MGLLIFLTILSVLIIVHEWGHYYTAKSLGVKVEKFSVGFGPKIFSKNIGGTDFMVSAIPLGGYVKMAGDERSSCSGNKEEFYSHPVGHRSLIVLMGPVINAIFAYLCFYFTFIAGYPILAARVGAVMDNLPAQEAGLLENDLILKIDSKEVEKWEDLQKAVMESDGKAMKFTLDRGGEQFVKTILPKQHDVDEDLVKVLGKKQWLIGVQPKVEVSFKYYGPVESLGKAFDEVGRITALTFRELFYVITGAKPAKEALGGPIQIFDVINKSRTLGFSYLVYVTAIISLSLAIFNLFPIPVLDGGHLTFFVIEKLRSKPIPIKIEENLTKVGFGLLMGLMVFVLYNDIVQVGWLKNVQTFMQSLNP